METRRLGLNKCVQKIANHPVLNKDQDFRFFLESDSFALDVRLVEYARAMHAMADNFEASDQTQAAGRFFRRTVGQLWISDSTQILRNR